MGSLNGSPMGGVTQQSNPAQMFQQMPQAAAMAPGPVPSGLQGVQFDTPEGYASQAAALAPPTPKTPPPGWMPPSVPKPTVYDDSQIQQDAYLQMMGGGHYGGVIPQSSYSMQMPGDPWGTLNSMGIQNPSQSTGMTFGASPWGK